MIDMPCVILSGGKSSRMQQDKSLMSFDKYPSLIEYQYKKLISIFSSVYISSKNNKFDDFFPSANLILDTGTTYSPMIALESILKKFEQKIFIITVDTPFVSQKTMRNLVQHSQGFAITLAKSGDRVHNLCGVFESSLLEPVRECLQKDIHKIGYLQKIATSNIVSFDNHDEFININTREDYQRAIMLYIPLQ